jgi:glycosyltransferase 2 family protein
MKRWFGFVLTVIIIALLAWVIKDLNFYEIYLMLAAANPFWLLMAFLATLLTFIAWTFRWMYLFKDVVKGDFWFLLNTVFAGSFFNTVTPGAGIAGEPFRAHFLAKRYKKPKTKMLGYVLGDKFFQLMLLAVFGIFSILFLLIYVTISDSLKLILEGVLILIFILIGLVIFFVLKKMKFNIGMTLRKLHKFKFIRKNFKSEDLFVEYINSRVSKVSKIFRRVVKKKSNIVVGFFLAAIYWVLTFLTAYFIFFAFGTHVDFLSVIIVITLADLIGAVSITPGGIGVIETSMTLIYSAMGVFLPLALLITFLTRVIYYFFTLFIGGMSLLYLRKVTNRKK